MNGFSDRIAAGQALAEALVEKDYADPVVLALPRGGVPVWLEVARIRGDVDEIICIETPEFFYAIGAHYIEFGQVPDEEVVRLLAEADRAFSEKAAEPEDHEPPES